MFQLKFCNEVYILSVKNFQFFYLIFKQKDTVVERFKMCFFAEQQHEKTT